MKRNKTATLFENPLLERLSRTNAMAAIRLYVLAGVCSIVLFVIQHVESFTQLALLPLGLLAFTFLEYATHRWLYHLPAHTADLAQFQYTVHGVHHDHPNDSDRQVMPLLIAIPIIVGFFCLFYILMGIHALAFFAGFIWGYSAYLFIHYTVHTQRPPRDWRQFWWKYHNIHHHTEPDRAYGVSSPLWDYVFGTAPKKKYKFFR